ncbi:hypothetical protein [Methylotenera sp.]|uniref:hypothetical protein n=1 Tax=Methylotenera sp. TaxID=2051956 RepID=UPI002487C3AF|nr:hypothetical protein [Methylotenera sp.]MDI1297738.1 hypothetical protein [Methylotenera sp.]
MKLLRTAVIALTIGVASISTASARDSFSLGVNIGGYGYAPPVAYYPAPPVVYYSQPTYYRSAPPVYYQPVVSYRYYNDGRRDYDGGWGREGREHHGWGRGDGDRGNWGHGGHDDGHHGGHR